MIKRYGSGVYFGTYLHAPLLKRPAHHNTTNNKKTLARGEKCQYIKYHVVSYEVDLIAKLLTGQWSC